MPRSRPRYDAAKRALDVLFGAAGLVLTAPLQAGVAAVVLATHGKPVLFRQKRPGRDEAVFELIKFRTMLEADEIRITDSERLTSVGRFLRSTSLDELPTLWNVLKGDMSLVGPRPLRTHYLPLYTAFQSRRHEVRPGVTGLAQVSGRNLLTWEERFALDVEYVDCRSLLVDLKIVVRTVEAVLKRKGVTAEDHVTMTPFRGVPCER